MDEQTLLAVVVIVLATIFVLVGVALLLRHRRDGGPNRQRIAFNERFPPITDDEYLARCRPGVNPAIALKVRSIVAGFLGVEPERIHPTMTFIEDIGAA